MDNYKTTTMNSERTEPESASKANLSQEPPANTTPNEREKKKLDLSLLFSMIAIVISIFALFKDEILQYNQVKILLTNKLDKKEAIKKLIKIEGSLSIVPNYTNDTTPKHPTLLNYYIKANRHLLSNLMKSKEKIKLVIGTPGCGKSFLFKNIDSVLKNEHIHIMHYDLYKQCRLYYPDQRFEKLPQLQSSPLGQNIILRYLPNNPNFCLSDILAEVNTQYQKSKTNYLFIDACDEVHPNAIRHLLSTMTDSLQKNPDINWHFILMGRPEAFKAYWDDPHTGNVSIHIDTIVNPQFLSIGDLRLRVKDALNNSNNSHLIQDTSITKIPEKLYELACHKENKEFIMNTINHLQLGNYLIEILAETNSESTISQLQNLLFDRLLKRSEQTHGKITNLELYKKLLKQVAINYAEKVDKQGFFNVNPSDETSVIFRKFGNKESLSFNTQDLLDFSGLLTTTSKYPHRYRFHPLWLHHYLLNLKD